jgi:glutamine amidotransferase
MIAVVDYKAGNLKSVERALRKLGVSCRVTQDRQEILDADRIVFPGVGAAGAAMEDLAGTGVDEVLWESFRSGTPILGICLGAQVILDWSEENRTPCLGLIPGKVIGFPGSLAFPAGGLLKIPHMGWNGIAVKKPHPVLEGITPADEFFFVHSYYPSPEDETRVVAVTEYGVTFPSVIGLRNLVAMQFHPEKSGQAGLRILKNFCTWDGRHAE